MRKVFNTAAIGIAIVLAYSGAALAKAAPVAAA
jgi:hypothetical protein